MSELTIAERVAAGVAWLDENKPGWDSTVELRQLDLYSAEDCVLGQTFGDYWKSALFADLDFRDTDDDELHELVRQAHDRAGRLGFYVPLSDSQDSVLAEWIRVITARRESSNG
jgi:hypothetical protein